VAKPPRAAPGLVGRGGTAAVPRHKGAVSGAAALSERHCATTPPFRRASVRSRLRRASVRSRPRRTSVRSRLRRASVRSRLRPVARRLRAPPPRPWPAPSSSHRPSPASPSANRATTPPFPALHLRHRRSIPPRRLGPTPLPRLVLLSASASARRLSPLARFLLDALRRHQRWGPPVVADLSKLCRAPLAPCAPRAPPLPP
jgi:hypothetical protein